MPFIFYATIFIFGLTVGSFLNCVIYRLQKDEEFLIKRSYCPHCHHTLSWQDLIPLISFLILRGKCRYCKNKISWQYPLIELATGFLFVFVAWHQLTANSEQLTFFNFFTFCYLLAVSCLLVVIFVFDLKHYIIPDKVIYLAILVSGIWYLVSSIFFSQFTTNQILNTIYSAIGAAGFFLAIILISRGKWMGWGDVKLGFFMGLLLGFPNIFVALFLAFFFGAIIGLGLIIAGKKRLKSEVPFGPFLVTGTFIALFWGKEIINWYIGLII